MIAVCQPTTISPRWSRAVWGHTAYINWAGLVVGRVRAASSSWISPSPPSHGGAGRGEAVRFYWFPLSSVLSPLVPRGERMKSWMQP